jgi:polyisoprenoid-binding protein YceI
VSITLHGTTRTFEVPARIETTPNEIVVSGQMHFNQTDFGIVPFSVLNGALQVQDRLDMRFRIVADSPR